MVQLVVIMVMALITLLLLAVGLTMKTERQLMVERMRKYGYEEAAQAPALTDDLAPSFTDRVVRPALQRLGAMGGGLAPGRSAEILRRRLEMAGKPFGLTPAEFSALKLLALAAGLVVGSAIAIFGHLGGRMALLSLVFFTCLGYLVPERWLNGKVTSRKTEVLRALPNAIDLVNVSVEAGLGFDGALSRIAGKSGGSLFEEFSAALREMSIGKSRVDALRDMAKRVDVPELTAFVAAVYQAEELGASLTSVLRVQAHMIRRKRATRAREIAAKLPVKMLFPLVVLIFPCIFIVILGPGVIQLMHSMLLK